LWKRLWKLQQLRIGCIMIFYFTFTVLLNRQQEFFYYISLSVPNITDYLATKNQVVCNLGLLRKGVEILMDIEIFFHDCLNINEYLNITLIFCQYLDSN
jgi:hypothetical protein